MMFPFNFSRDLQAVVVADATASAVQFWPQTAKAIADILAVLPKGAASSVHFLGTRSYREADEWSAEMLPPPEANGNCRLIAPVMRILQARHEHPVAIVLVTTGPVFDLADWVDNGARWAWVRMNNIAQLPPDLASRVSEVMPDNLASLVDLLDSPSTTLPPHHPVHSAFVKHQWRLDRAGYPMVYVEPLKAYAHLFPVAKPLFEHFMAEARLREYNDAWYADVLALNPRLSTAVSFADYEQLFISGLLPDDVLAFARWHEQGTRLLSVEQWRAMFRWMENQDVSALPFELERELAPTAQCLWAGLLTELRPKTLLDLSLMRGGVVEWVEGPNRALLGMGQPRETFHPMFHDALHDKPFEPTSLSRRSKLFGFRLIVA